MFTFTIIRYQMPQMDGRIHPWELQIIKIHTAGNIFVIERNALSFTFFWDDIDTNFYSMVSKVFFTNIYHGLQTFPAWT